MTALEPRHLQIVERWTLGLSAIVLARRAGDHVQWTLGRAGGEVAARIGRALGLLGVCLAITAGLALGVFGLLSVLAS